MKRWAPAFIAVVILVVLLSLYLAGLFVGPRVSQSQIEQERLWLINIPVTKYFGISLNKDSFYYMEAAKHPAVLFDKRSILQSRPLLPLIASAPVYLLESQILRPKFSEAASDSVLYYLAPYLIYVGMNVFVIIASFLLYLAIIANYCQADNNLFSLVNPVKLPFIIGLSLFFNEITKAFVLSAHAQMFNIFVPMYALMVSLYVYSAKTIRLFRIMLLSSIVGFGILAYDSFAVCWICIMLALIARKIIINDVSLQSMAAIFVISSICVVVPFLTWYMSIIAVTGSFYYHAINGWNLLVWIFDARDNGVGWLVSRLAENLIFFIRGVMKHTYPILGLIMILIAFLYWVREHIFQAVRTCCQPLVWSFVVGIMFLCFYSLVGYCVDRLAFPPVTMLIFMTGLISCFVQSHLERLRCIVLVLLSWALIIGMGIVMVMKDGPYS